MPETDGSPGATERSPEEIRDKIEFYEELIENERATRYQKGKCNALLWVLGERDDL